MSLSLIWHPKARPSGPITYVTLQTEGAAVVTVQPTYLHRLTVTAIASPVAFVSAIAHAFVRYALEGVMYTHYATKVTTHWSGNVYRHLYGFMYNSWYGKKWWRRWKS